MTITHILYHLLALLAHVLFGLTLLYSLVLRRLERPKMVAIIKKIIKGLSSSALAVSV